MADKTIFDYLNAIYNKKQIPYDKKVCSAYMLSLWLSHDAQLIDTVNTLNEFQFFLPDNLIYDYYYHKIPMGRRYIKWTKKEEVDKKVKEKYDSVRKELMLSKLEMSKYKAFTSILSSSTISDKKKNVVNASSVFL